MKLLDLLKRKKPIAEPGPGMPSPEIVQQNHGPSFSEEDIKLHPEMFDRERIRREYGGDPWLCNLALNAWEFATRQTIVKSYPVDITLPCIEYCNARKCPLRC